MALISVTGAPNDANDGQIGQNIPRIGNRTYGQRTFLSGTERPIETATTVYEWYGFESLTVSSTALGLTEGLSELADIVMLTFETNAVRYRLDGQAPTATVGHTLTDGDVLTLTGRFEIDKFQVIRRDGTDATARASYGQRRYD